jgi:hypothetical protein
MKHGVNNVLCLSRGGRYEHTDVDKCQSYEDEQNSTDNRWQSLDQRVYSLEETESEEDEQQTKNDEIGALNPAIGPDLKIADWLVCVVWLEEAIQQEDGHEKDGSNDSSPKAEAESQTLLSAR